jgi:hypothetical protein
MKTITFLILLLSTSSFVTAQKNYVQISANGLGGKSFLDFSFERETQKSYTLSIGLQMGNFGKRNFTGGKFQTFEFPDLPRSPYEVWEDTTTVNGYLFRKKSFTTSNVGVGLEIGGGYRWRISNKNLVDIGFNLAYYFIEDNHSHTYKDVFTDLPPYTSSYKTKHQTFANYTKATFIRKINDKISIFTGGQVFYFIPIKNELYNNEDPRNPMLGVEGNLFCGLKYKL